MALTYPSHLRWKEPPNDLLYGALVPGLRNDVHVYSTGSSTELKSVDIGVEKSKELVTGRLRWRQERCGGFVRSEVKYSKQLNTNA